MSQPPTVRQRVGLGRPLGALCLVLIVMAASTGSNSPEIIGSDPDTSFSVCEANSDSRPECQAADVRFQAGGGGAGAGQGTEFGFAIAMGHLNGDELEDLVVGDPVRNRVYIFLGRRSVADSYGLNPLNVSDREVPADQEADIILERDPAIPGQVGSLGFAVAVGEPSSAAGCAPDDMAAPLLIGAPGKPGTTGNAPGTVFYIPAGGLCLAPSDPPARTVLDPADVGQAVGAPVIEEDDEFGYALAFGHLMTTTGTDQDIVVGARAGAGGHGKVVIFPVTNGAVLDGADDVVEIVGAPGDGLGEALAVGDLDQDFDADTEPFGGTDDLAASAVGAENGKVLLVQGPLSPAGGLAGDGVFREGNDAVKTIPGESPGDFFGFDVAVGGDGRLAVGAIYANNETGGSARTNVDGLERINAGKAYVWDPPVFVGDSRELEATSADDVLVARRSGDHLGFAVSFGDLDVSGDDDLVVTARREDGSGLRVDEIDQGTAYVIFDDTFLSSPVDLDQCVTTSDCTGVAGVDVLIFGGDRNDNRGDEMGFAAAIGDFNGDGSPDLFLSSNVQHRVYAIALDDADKDRGTEGRNIRDDDDDGDGDGDGTDCAPLDDAVSSSAEEITCNGVDENCNGMEDDAPDADGDGFDACGDDETEADCDDDDANSYPGAPELCDGNDNACSGSTPFDERDIDVDGWVECGDWDDTQGDDPDILGGGDCGASSADVFPGAAPLEADPEACLKDSDDDDYGDASDLGEIPSGTDCDDESPSTFPGAADLDDSAACMRDDDDDGYGDATVFTPVTAGSDCADDDAFSYPGADELCDGNDNACAGAVPNDETDSDGDGFVACAPWDDVQLDDPGVNGGDDCDPADEFIFPGAAPLEAVPTACMKDADNDDYGDVAPPETAIAGTDCDDDSQTTFPGAAQIEAPLNCMKDDDDDGYGDDSVTLPIVPGGDCADDDATRHAGAMEIPGDDIDQDCNGSDTLTCFVDDDRDGFGSTTPLDSTDGDCTDPGESELDTDCDDNDDTIFPGQTEIPDDDIDQDCNDADTVTCFEDGDGDGAGTQLGTTTLADDGSCDAEQQESLTEDDCDDADANTFPGAAELCDGNDNDCDDSLPVDETDGDGDTWVPCSGWNDTQGDDSTIGGGDDCDDSRATIFPGAAENEPLAAACMKDLDEDGFGDVSPPDGVTPGTDCNDEGIAAAETFPGAAPLDGPLNCMKDSDGDDYGDLDVSLPVVAGTDCRDDDPVTFLGAPEQCDGNDNACSGSVPVEETDLDGDDHVACAGWNDVQGDDPAIAGGNDCDETASDTFPGAAPNEGFPTACMKDSDADDYGDLAPPAGVTAGTDCDDDGPFAATTFPGAAAIDGPLNCMKDDDNDDFGDGSVALPIVPGGDCDDDAADVNPRTLEGPQGDASCSDGVDNDCDGDLDDDDLVCQGVAVPCPDADDDGFADCVTDPSCDASGLTCGDCDDIVPAVNPDEPEQCDNIDNNCDGSTDEGFDADDDGFTVCQLPVADCDDDRPAVNPAAVELCGDDLDNDCDAATVDLFDADGDGATCDVDCNDANPALNLDDADTDGVTTCDGDCDDDDSTTSPTLPELCNDGKNNDCDLDTPDIFDGDEDGVDCVADCDDGDPAANLDDVDDDTFSTCDGDCDDMDAEIRPTATELCDGIDNNCDGNVDEPFDGDNDGYTTCGQPEPDCNDMNALVNPGADEVCNDGVDNDCDPGTPDLIDADDDGANCLTDCDDGDAASWPGAMEICDGNDNTCSGSVPGQELDSDGDGYVECSGWSDVQGDDTDVIAGGDCDGTSAFTFPGAAPNEPVPDACMKDFDGDDYGDLVPPAGVVAGTDCDDDGPFALSTFPGAAAIDGPLNCMKDVDDDDYGDDSVSLPVVRGTDCDDDGQAVNPGATEGPLGDPTCFDGEDNDCDESADEEDPQCNQGLRLRRPRDEGPRREPGVDPQFRLRRPRRR